MKEVFTDSIPIHTITASFDHEFRPRIVDVSIQRSVVCV